MQYLYQTQNITNRAFQHENGTTYLKDWILELDTPAKRAALGITEEAEPVPQTPEPYQPTIVDMRQARLALLQAGLLPVINAAIESLGEAAKIEWEFASVVRRDSPLIEMVKQGQGLTDTQIDELFLLASTL